MVRESEAARNRGIQEVVYSSCVDRLLNRTDPPTWVMFLDGDEFLVLRQHANVTAFVQQHLPKGGALQISTVDFGTANLTNYEPVPVLKRFPWRRAEPHHNTKTIVVLEHLQAVTNPHYVLVKPGYKRHAMDGRPKEPSLGGAWCCLPLERHDTSVAAIHHYKYKSIEEHYYRRCVRGRIYKDYEFSFCGQDTWPGEVYDDTAWDILKRHHPKYRIFDDEVQVQ